jgi:hypothetical protein
VADLAPHGDEVAPARRPRWLVFAINLAVSLGLGALFTWLALREVDFSKVADVLAKVEYVYVLPYVGVMILIHLIRVWRWRILLAPLERVSFARLLPIASVGFLAIALLPFRMGEFVRPYLVVEKGTRLTFSGALATCVVERVIDALLVIGLLFAALATVERTVPAGVITAATWALVVFGALLLAIIVALWKREASIAFWNRAIGLLSKRLAARLTGILGAFIDGLRSLEGARHVAGVVVLSLLYWGVAAFGLWLVFRAFHLDLPLTAALVVNGILVIGIMVPGGPAFTGPFELAVRVALVDLFLLSEEVNAGYTLVLHGLQFGFQLAVGLLFLFSRHVSFVKLSREARRAAQDAGATVQGG